jgi:hypothetical protein
LLTADWCAAPVSKAEKSLSITAVGVETGVKSDSVQSDRARRERAVLTNRPAAKALAWSFARVGAVIGLSATMLGSAHAAGIGGLSCIGGFRNLNCMAQWGFPGDPHVRPVPETLGAADKAQAATRERRWLIHCNPVIARDAYGVARYQYAVPGCEYGIGGE